MKVEKPSPLLGFSLKAKVSHRMASVRLDKVKPKLKPNKLYEEWIALPIFYRKRLCTLGMSKPTFTRQLIQVPVSQSYALTDKKKQ